MINFSGAPIPVPFTSISAGYGVTESATAHGSLHTTSAMFGVIQIDGGVLKEVYTSKDSTIGITVSPNMNIAMDIWEKNFRAWPNLDINAYWHYNRTKSHFAYTGVTNWFELSRYRAHGEEQPQHWIPALNLGHQFTGSKNDFFIETKYMAPFTRNDETVIDYLKPFGNKGVLGIYFGFRKRF